MRTTFLSLAIICSAALTAQVHEAGTILFSVNYEIGPRYIGGYSVEGDDFGLDLIDDDKVTAGLIRVDGQFGITDAFSFGVLARFGTFTIEDGAAFGTIHTNNKTKNKVVEIGIEPRFHFVNSDAIAVYAGPCFGISNTTPDEVPDGIDEDDLKQSGVFWGAAAGMHYFFTDIIGANVRLGFGRHGYKDDVEFDTETRKVKNTYTGFEASFGLAIKL